MGLLPWGFDPTLITIHLKVGDLNPCPWLNITHELSNTDIEDRNSVPILL